MRVLLGLGAAAALAALWRTHRRRVSARAQTAESSSPLVVVVGLGGVGSHAAHLLLRSGVRNLRLIDFDQVTLSSLNRHATATRAHVGTPKAVALRNALLAIDGGARIDARPALFCANDAPSLLEGSPALVIDAIDDIATKVELLTCCAARQLPVLCALSAGGRADAARLHVVRLSDVHGDAMAAVITKRLRKLVATESGAGGEADGSPADGGGGGDGDGRRWWWEELQDGVECVSCSAEQRASLLPLPQGSSATEMGSQPSFRVRVMPVLPPLPAAFGATLASRALKRLEGGEGGEGGSACPPPTPLPPLTRETRWKIYLRFVSREVRELGRPVPDLSLDEVGVLAIDVFRGRCALSGMRIQDPARPAFVLTRLDPARPSTLRNVLFVTSKAAKAHERDGLAAMPPPLRAQIEARYDAALRGRGRSLFEAMLEQEGAARPVATSVVPPGGCKPSKVSKAKGGEAPGAANGDPHP